MQEVEDLLIMEEINSSWLDGRLASDGIKGNLKAFLEGFWSVDLLTVSLNSRMSLRLGVKLFVQRLADPDHV